MNDESWVASGPWRPDGLQTHVDVIEAPGFGRRGQGRDQPLGQPRVVNRRTERPAAVRLARVGGKIVDQNEIEVGGGGHLARAELAEPDHRDPAAAHAPVLGREGVRDLIEHDRDQSLRERAIGAAGAVGIEAPRQEVEADVERLLGGEIAGAVQRLLVSRRLGDESLDPLAHPVVVEARLEADLARRVDRRVEHMGPGRDHLREPRRAPEHVAEQLAQGGVGAQDRQQLDAGRHPRQRFVEGGERGVRVARAGEGFEQRRRQLGHDLPRPRAADRRAAAEMPAANGFRRGLRALEPERAQGRKRLRIVDDAGEDEIADRGAERRRVLEQPGVVMLDPGQMAGHVLHETVEPRVAAELGEAGERRLLERQPLGLLVLNHLQPVLDPAQEHVRPAEIVDRLGADPLVGVKALEHVEGARPAHLRTAAAEDELLGLDEELDLADAAAPELDVVSGNDDPLVAAHGVDLALHRMDVGDRRVVEILAPDERREVGKEALAELEVARRRARLDERGALPVLADRLVIGIGAERSRARPGSKRGRA